MPKEKRRIGDNIIYNKYNGSPIEDAAIVDDLQPWYKIIQAKHIGADIHAYPFKSSKLDIVAGAEHQFGQYIIDKENQ